MKNLLRNKNFWMIAAVVVLIAAALIVGLHAKSPAPNLVEGDSNNVSIVPQTDEPTAAPTAEASSEPAPQDATASDLATSTDAQPAKAYVIVTAGNESRIFPVPDEGEYSFSVVLHHEDGEDSENVVHVTSDGVYMEKSTCDNQDCVEQGTVTIDNRKERALYNMIVCLPNQVMLELYTPDELLELFSDSTSAE